MNREEASAFLTGIAHRITDRFTETDRETFMKIARLLMRPSPSVSTVRKDKETP